MAPTYTYSFDPNTSNKDAVRFLCQDTDMVTAGAARLCDEEINWTLTKSPNVFLAAAVCADTIAGYWAKIQNTRIGPLNIQRSQAVTFYQAVAAELRRMASRFHGGAQAVFYPVNDPKYIGTNNGNNGPQHIFTVGIDDYPTFSIFWPPPDLPPLTTYP